LTWTTFGFGGVGSAYVTADAFRYNKIPATNDNLNFELDTVYPIALGSLKVYVNGVCQAPNLDYVENPDGKSFSWLSSEEITSDDYVSVDYLVA
jgi:hypothetical protein